MNFHRFFAVHPQAGIGNWERRFRRRGRCAMAALAICLCAGAPPSPAQARPALPPQHQHDMGAIPTVRPVLPRLGRSQDDPARPRITLQELEQMALAGNPTLRQSAAEISTALARQKQAGLYPNPTVGYSGEEIRGGSFGGGQHGIFVAQPIVTAGKLGLSRNVAAHDVRISQMEAEEQRLRVMNGVRIAFYRVLAAQELLDLRRDQLRISEGTLKTIRQLRNIGQADEPELLEAEVEHQKHEMAVAMQEQSLRQTWRALAAAAGRPQLELRVVAGSLEKDLPQLDDDAVLQRLVNESPAMGIARAAADRAHATVARERRAPVPDIEIRAGLQRNGEALDPSRRAAGLQGFAEVGVQIPLWNRNQGSVEAARRQAERAQSEIQRVELVLRDRAASVLDAYHTARILTERYRTQLLPRAQKAYVLTLDKYGTMLASYPQVLRAERMLYQLQGEYIGALESHWLSAIALEGLLLTDALEAPARPADVDLPVREVNMPSGSRAILRERP